MLFQLSGAAFRRAEFALRLRHGIPTLMLVGLAAVLSIDTGNKVLSSDSRRAPNIVLILVDDQYDRSPARNVKHRKSVGNASKWGPMQIAANRQEFRAIRGD